MKTPLTMQRKQVVPTLTSFLLAALALLLGGASANAQALCRPVHGHIVAGAQTPPTCGGDFCSVGSFSGGIQGEYVVATMINAEQPVQDIYYYTGDTAATVQIGDQQGVLQIKNTGLFRVTGELTELETITGGTGDLAGATGLLFVSGTSGEESGRFTYSGTVCLP
jgi:hypothetical protein